jgi:hypothetical protein
MARVAASARWSTPNLLFMFETWTVSVFVLMKRLTGGVALRPGQEDPRL